MQIMRSRLTHPPVLISILTLIGYGLLLPHTGFYWDDWPFAWIANFLGPREFIPAFLPFRPFLGPIFFATTSLIPPVPVYWQIFALIIRLLMGFAAWWTFKQIWPQRPSLATSLALLITVFPGYSQHWVAFTHINQELIPFIFLILSFGFTFKALRSGQPQVFTALALLTQICGVFPTEYFFGIEGIRGLLLFSSFTGGLIKRARDTARTWWPHLGVWMLNALWLVYYYRLGPYNSYQVTAPTESTPGLLIPEALDTLWKVCFYIWWQVVILVSINPAAPSSLMTVGLIVAVFVILLPVSHVLADENGSRNFAWTLIAVGLTGILLGRLPSLAAGLPLRLQSSYDRFMVSMMIGGSMFLVGLVEMVFQNQRIRTAVLALILALGVGQQFYNANIFRRDWENQQEIYWELTWRIPALEPGTLLLTDQMPVDYETDLSFTAPINWIYAPDFKPPNLPFALLYVEKRLGGPTLPSLKPGTPVFFPYRTVDFRSTTSQAVVIYKPSNGCLRVLDPSRDDAVIYAHLPSEITDAVPLSKPARIITDADNPAAPFFLSSEPDHGWCYYFTRAELAYQMNDHKMVITLLEQATALDYRPQDPNEWLIFIESRALTAGLEQAGALSRGILHDNPRMRRGVCTVWKRLQPADVNERGLFSQILSDLGCPD